MSKYTFLILSILLISCKNSNEMDFAGTGIYTLSTNEKQEVLTKPVVDSYDALFLNDSLTILPLHRYIKSTNYQVFISLGINQRQSEIVKNLLPKVVLIDKREMNEKTELFFKSKNQFVSSYIYDKTIVNGTVVLFFVSSDSSEIHKIFSNSNFLKSKIKDE